MKRREFLISGVCSVGALIVARSLFASSEPPTGIAPHASSQRYYLHGSARTGCARPPGEESAWESVMLPTYSL